MARSELPAMNGPAGKSAWRSWRTPKASSSSWSVWWTLAALMVRACRGTAARSKRQAHSSRCRKPAGSRPNSARVVAVWRSHAHEIGVFGVFQREIHDRAPRSAPWSRRRAFGGIEPADEGGDHQGRGYGATVGLKGDLVRHLDSEDAVRCDAGADPVEILWTSSGFVRPATWPRRRSGPGQGDSVNVNRKLQGFDN